MFFLTIGMYLVTFDLIFKKKKIGAGANSGEGGPEKQLFFTMALLRKFVYKVVTSSQNFMACTQ